MPRSTSQNFCCQCPCPHVEPQPPPASAGDPPTLAGRSGSVSYGGHCSFPWVLMHILLCVCPPRMESLFPPVLSKSCNQIPLAFKVWFSRNSSSRCQTPRLGSLRWGSEPSLQWVDFCGISVLQSVSHPSSSYGSWFHCDCALPTVSLWLLLCLWMWGIFFGEFQRLPVDDCSAVSCDSSAPARGSERTTFYSAIFLLRAEVWLNVNFCWKHFPFPIALVENQLTTYVRIYFWTLYFVSFIYRSLFSPIPNYFDYFSFRVSLEIW